MTDADVHWKQRFENFTKALVQLNEADELTWNTLRDFLAFQGISDLIGSRDTMREAFKRRLISDDEGWMMMLNDRNRSSHTYNQTTADDIVKHIHGRYVDLFHQLSATLQAHRAAG